MFRVTIMTLVITSFLGCGRGPQTTPTATTASLEEVATSDRRWTGIAAAPDGRIFVNYPRWTPQHDISVGMLGPDGTVAAYPSASANAWSPGDDPSGAFVCVQAMLVDDRDRLWILDPANPMFQGVVEGGPKLVEVDLTTDEIVRTIGFDSEIASGPAYLNDLRIDTSREVAYLTDSGDPGLVIVDLASGEARRVLEGDVATSAEDVTLTIGGTPWLQADGSRPRVHADGVALSPDRDWLYWQALTGRTLYRIPTSALRSPALSPDGLALQVDRVAAVGASDGIMFGPDRALYLTSLEHDAIRRWTPERGVETVVSDPRISWPDSFALAPDGSLLFTTAQIHRFLDPPQPFRVLRIRP